MSIEGTITVSALFQDRDGDNRLKVAALRSATEYTTGKVAVITGTAGTAAVTIFSTDTPTPYRDATGELVILNLVTRGFFRWSGSVQRVCELETFEGLTVALASSSGSVTVSDVDGRASVTASLLSSEGTGTYTILLYGT